MEFRGNAATMLASISLLCLGFMAAPIAVAGPQQPAGSGAGTAPQSGETTASVATNAREPLEEVVITGSLIPRATEVSAVPTTLITADDMVNRGYVSIADALQQQVYATGSVQGAQFSNGFTPGAQTLSLFGLSPSYVKYLIDGRPMADYPALYNGSDVISNISGIPEDLIERIDILPGGQSSLYGSDAIAGVVNVVMKKNIDELTVKAVLGGFNAGGGTDRRITASDGHDFGVVNVMGGVEYEKVDPIWGYQRQLTSRYYDQGSGPAVAERDWLVYGPFSGNAYYFEDPNNCANVTMQYFGSVDKQTRADRGDYCGTFSSGYNTIGNSTETTQGYLRATADVNPSLHLYADALLAHESAKFSVGSLFWDTTDVAPYGVIYDPNIDDFVALQHIFSPEEDGGLNNTLNSADTDSWRGTIGANGDIGHSNWTYDVGFTYTSYKLTENTHVMLATPTDNYYYSVLGPNLGPDPYGFDVPTYSPDYAQFYSPISQQQFTSMSTLAPSRSKTWDTMLRGQVTNASLFHLPGGDAGIALVAEGGNQDWNYSPDPGYFDGSIWGYTAVAGDGHRSRYAFTGELRLPVEKWLTLVGSTRYDSYHVSGENVSANTYDVGIELRPMETLLLRGRYGTAFKAPTLADEFQGESGYYVTANDYYQCALAGYTGSDISDCLDAGISVKGVTTGSTTLQPIRASVSSIGMVWSPTHQFYLSADYLHWNISNEVNQIDPDRLLNTENQCRQGTLDISSPTCVATLDQVHRDGAGDIDYISTPKINVANETVNAFVFEGSYSVNVGAYGSLMFQGAWTDMLTHTVRLYPGDPALNYLTDPTQSQEFKSKVNGSVTWNIDKFSTTLYFDRHGKTPNYAATLDGAYGNEGAGTLTPWTVFNLTMRYSWSSNLEFAFSALNLFNAMPPEDHSYPGTTSVPYNEFNYNVYGLAYYGQVTYRLGSK